MMITKEKPVMKRSRGTIVIATAIAAAVALSACSSGGGTSGGAVLKFLIWDNGPQSIVAYKSLVAGFEKENPTIKVNLETANTKDYDNLLKTRLSGGAGPDIYGVRPQDTPALVKGGYLADVTSEPWFTSLTASAQDAPNAVQDGKAYAFPIIQSGDGIVFNKALFSTAGIKDAPTTLSGLIDASKKLKDAGITPFAMSAGDGWWTQFILYHLTAPNVAYAEPKANADIMAGKSTFSSSPGWRKSLEIYKQLIPYYMPDPVGTPQAAAQSAFLQGNAAMFPASWILPEVRKTSLDVGYFNFPATENANTPAIWGSYQVQLGLNPKNGNVEAAKKFAAYLFSDQEYPSFLAKMSSFPVKDGVTVANSDPLAPTLIAAWKGKTFEPSPNDTWLPGIADAMVSALQNLTAGKASVDDVLKTMDDATQAALKK
ncbi:MAG: ABC transporter substrate-binding protein [Lacisediminihabitans sp.]